MPNRRKKHSHVLVGASHEQVVKGALKRLGIPASDATLIAQRCNPITQSSRYGTNIVIVREPNETRISQVARLVRCLGSHRSATYFWRPAIGLVRNMPGLIFLSGICGLRTEVVHEGKAYTLRQFLLSRFRSGAAAGLDWAGWMIALVALVFSVFRNISRWLQRRLRGFLFWFRPTFLAVPASEMTESFNKVASCYFNLEECLQSRRRATRMGALLQLVFWATSCLIFGILYWPWIFLNHLVLGSPDKKRILLVSHESRMNGAPASLITILESIDRDEFEPYLLSASEGLLTQRARAVDIPTFILPLSQFLTQLPSFRGLALALIRMAVNFPYLLYLLVYLRIRVVHTNVLVTPDTALAAKTVGITSLWHFRECINDNLWARFAVHFMNIFSDRVFCNSEYSRHVLHRKGVFWLKMVTVHNALDQKQFRRANCGGSRFRKSLRVGKDDLLIGCVGQITQVKGQEAFVKAAIEVAKQHPNVHFAIVGTLENGDYVQFIRELIREADLEKRFTFAGFRTDIPEVMAALDIHVTPSLWAEPFGRVALEAMGAGATSVVSGIGGLKEIVEDNISGVQFPAGDTRALADILSRLIKDIRYRKRLSQNGVRRALMEFSVEKQTDIVQQTYRYPRHNVTRLTQCRMWSVLRKYLPGRMRPHPKLLVYYPFLTAGVAALWVVALSCFFCLVPFAMLTGVVTRRSGTKNQVAVLAYQTIRNASTRYRITRIFHYISRDLVNIRIFYPSSNWIADKVYVALFYGNAPHIRDFYFYVVVFLNRLYAILRCYAYQTVIIQYELFHEGPMWMEILVAKTHPRVIYDYDDSLYIFPRYRRWLPKVLKQVQHVVVGNLHIGRYTKQFNSNITYIPTCPDNIVYAIKPGRHGTLGCHKTIDIGWVGNPANLFYLPMVTGAIRRLSKEHDIRFVIVSSGPYNSEALDIDDLPLKRKEWSLQREIDDIQFFDIGIMPVIDDELGRGKCGFKALQYMAAGVPCVISPVGVNAAIIDHGITGFLAVSENDWYQYLKQLVESPELRASIAQNAFEYTHEKFNMRNWSKIWRILIMADDSSPINQPDVSMLGH